METITTTTKVAFAAAAAGWLIGAVFDRQIGVVVFGLSFIAATLSICIPILRRKASNWGERGFKLFAVGFMTGAIPGSASMIVGKANWADPVMTVGITICFIAMAIIFLNWKSLT